MLGDCFSGGKRAYKRRSIFVQESINYLDTTVDEIFERTFKKKLQSPIEIRPYNAEQTKNMRELNPQVM